MRRRIYGGNSGYEGYSKSKRAIDAENRGLCNKSQINKVFADKVSDIVGKKITISQIKKDLNNIPETEWHHTSSWGNKTSYYSAEDVAKYYEKQISPKKNAENYSVVQHIDPKVEKAQAYFKRKNDIIEKIRASVEKEYGLYLYACATSSNTNTIVFSLVRGREDICDEKKLKNPTEKSIKAWIQKAIKPYMTRKKSVDSLMAKYGINEYYFSPYTLRFWCKCGFYSKEGFSFKDYQYDDFMYPIHYHCYENFINALKIALSLAQKGKGPEAIYKAIKEMPKVEFEYD